MILWLLACTGSVGGTALPPVSPAPTADTGVEGRTYVGGWPERPDLDELPTGDWERRPRVGERFPPFVGRDAFGDDVHLYDFLGEGPVVLDLSALWCGICREMASWLDRQQDGGFSPEALRDAVDAGEVRWITVISEDVQGGPADEADVQAWHEAFPHPRVPVLLDADGSVASYVRAYGFPRLILLDEELRIVHHDRPYDEVLEAALP